MVKMSLILATVFVSGCICDPVIIKEPVEVYIPVEAKCPDPIDIPKPYLPVNDLTIDDVGDYKKVIKVYSASLSTCMSYAEEQEEVLNSYRKEIENGKEEKEEQE